MMAPAPRLRQPVVVVLGHVDSGKTSLLDKIRGTAVQAREVGGMTQHIGASFFPTDTLAEICGPLLKRMGGEVRVPGLLVIDTPGHEVFTNLRSRGGSAADLAILVVDVMKGFEVQTYESLEILKRRRVPFVVALNKVDLIPGWRSTSQLVSEAIKAQAPEVIDQFEERLYNVVGTLSRLGFNSEAYFRVKDFTKEVALVPTSAKTGEGIPELLAVLLGLAQRYLTKRLTIASRAAKGIVLEVTEEPGLGHTANVILLEGLLVRGDQVVVGKREGPIATRVRALFMPKPLDEMRDPRDKFSEVEEVTAAAGVKIVTPDLKDVLPGSPLLGVSDGLSLDEAKREVEKELKPIFIASDQLGVIIKADTIGSLEAISEMLKGRKVPIRIADIGPVSRREVVEASTVREKDPYLGIILSFGVKVLPDALSEASKRGVPIFSDPLVYRLVEGYTEWVKREKEEQLRRQLESVTPLCEFQVLRGMVFRRSSPAIFGIEILAGRLRQKVAVMSSEGRPLGTIHQIQDRGEPLPEVEAGRQVAVSMNEPTFGRHIREGDVLYTLPSEQEIKLLQNLEGQLRPSEVELLRKIIAIRRKAHPTYGF